MRHITDKSLRLVFIYVSGNLRVVLIHVSGNDLAHVLSQPLLQFLLPLFSWKYLFQFLTYSNLQSFLLAKII